MRNLFFFVVLFLGCTTLPTPLPPTPDPPPDPVLDDASYCVMAGTNIGKVCPAMSKTPDGKLFAQFCKEKMAQGVPMNPKCIAKATTCAAANICIGSY